MRYLKLVQPTLHRVRQAPVIDVETNVGPRRNAGEYTWPFHYHAIRMASKLQSSGHFAEVVGDACVLLGAELPTRLPSRWTLQRWELKLDIADMLYHRKALNTEVSEGVTARRSLSSDSSPQAGFNFLCAREERCCIVDGVLREFSSQSLPVLTFGSAPFEVHRRPSENNKQLPVSVRGAIPPLLCDCVFVAFGPSSSRVTRGGCASVGSTAFGALSGSLDTLRGQRLVSNISVGYRLQRCIAHYVQFARIRNKEHLLVGRYGRTTQIDVSVSR